VVGFSIGGAAVLAHASRLPELVGVGIAYYPLTNWYRSVSPFYFDHRWGSAPDIVAFVPQFQTPILMFAGENDHFAECCLIGTARAMEVAARQSGRSFEMVVYPAQHGFIMIHSANFDEAASKDAWERTLASLHRYVGGQRGSSAVD
jgi:dienelactone hydrolase